MNEGIGRFKYGLQQGAITQSFTSLSDDYRMARDTTKAPTPKAPVAIMTTNAPTRKTPVGEMTTQPANRQDLS